MLQIHINNKPAILKTGTQIKFTRENPFFSEAGDYTLDVTFPLAGCPQNQKIFGAVHRAESSKKTLLSKNFTFRLQADLFSLAGKATVTSVTQEEVKLQLLSGKSAFNFDTINNDNGEDLYIDELNLGSMTEHILSKLQDWMADHWDEYYAHASDHGFVGLNNSLPAALISKVFTAQERNRYMFGSSDVTPCVFFPIYSEEDEAWSNELDYRYWGEDVYMGDDANPRHVWRDDLQTYFFRLYKDLAFPLPQQGTPGEYLFQRLNIINEEWVEDEFSIAPQPYLCWVVEKIFSALGYTLRPEDNAIRQGAFKNVFIANARNTHSLTDVLPHWTVKDFFTNLQNFMNIMFIIEGDKVKILSRNTAYLDGTPTILREVTDEQSTDLDEDEDTKDPTSGNVGYAFPDDMVAKNVLGDDRYKEVEVRFFDTYTEIENDLNSLDHSTKTASNILYIDMSTGERYYIHWNFTYDTTTQEWNTSFELKTIDLMGAMFRIKNTKIDTELKFVPCRMADNIPTYRTKMDWGTNILKYAPSTPYPIHPENIDLDGGQYGGFHIPYLITSDSRESISESKLNLSAEVLKEPDEDSEETESTSKRDVIELAWNVGAEHQFVYEQTYNPLANYAQTIQVELQYPVSIPYRKDRFGNWIDEGEHLFVIRHRNASAQSPSIARELDGFSFDIDTRSVTQFQFTDNIFDPSAVVIIRGRKYVCQKLEVTIDDNGLQPMKRGYFYELGT